MKDLFKKEPAAIIGALGSVVVVICEIVGLDGFDDGLQWEEVVAMLAPLGIGGAIRQNVYSPKTVEELLPATPLGKEKDAAAALDVPTQRRTK